MGIIPGEISSSVDEATDRVEALPHVEYDRWDDSKTLEQQA